MHGLKKIVGGMGLARRWYRLGALLVIISMTIVGSVPTAAADSPWQWPNCNWQCQANDVQVTRVWLGDAAGNELPASCQAGSEVTAYFWAEIKNTTSAERYAYGVIADVVVGGQQLGRRVACFDSTIAGGETKRARLYGPLTWQCGSRVSLENMVIFWDVDSGAKCTADCAASAMGQCHKIDKLEFGITCDLAVTVQPDAAELCCETPATTLTATVAGAAEGAAVSYQWYYRENTEADPVPIVGANGNTLGVGSAGLYYVQVMSGECSATSAEVAVQFDQSNAPSVTVDPASAQLICPSGGGVLLTATVDELPVAAARVRGLASPGQAYTYQWYRDGSPISGASGSTYVADAPGSYWVRVGLNGCEGESNHVQVSGCVETPVPTKTPVTPEPPCERSYVTAVINGGWAGIVVETWVGGTAQPAQVTGLDSEGRAAASWTFYPPEGTSWAVRVVPQLPPGLDPARWKFAPASRSLSVKRCQQYTAEFQLVDSGEGDEGPQAVVVILPVTGETAPQAGWWQGLLQWLRGLIGR